MAGPLLKRAASLVGIPPATFNDVSQAGHFCAGWAAVFTAIVLIGPGWWWFGAAAIVLFALGKEFWYDERYESVEVRGSGMEDFAFYVAGAVAALAVYGVGI